MRLLTTFAALCLITGCNTQPAVDQPEDQVVTSASSAPITQNITLYFGDQATIIASDCSAVKGASRTLDVPQSELVDATLRALLEGTTAAEEARGLTDAFTGKSAPLIESYQGISITDAIATVDFTEAGLEYLNAEACWQAQVKNSIEETLYQFLAISVVNYSINGELFTEWDA